MAVFDNDIRLSSNLPAVSEADIVDGVEFTVSLIDNRAFDSISVNALTFAVLFSGNADSGY